MNLVKLTRFVTFSSGHRYWFSHLSPDENKQIFGSLASPFSHGHNYTLMVECIGPVSIEHGMVINIKTIDDIIKNNVCNLFDFKSINDEIPYFDKVTPTTENILIFIRDILIKVVPKEVNLTKLTLVETPTLSAELKLNTDMVQLTRTYEFAASHRLHSSNLDDATNIQLFGKCNHINGHGHNYVLEVTVSGIPDPVTGMITNIDQIDKVTKEIILDRYDHRNLDMDIEELQGKTTTSEVVVTEIFKQLDGKLSAQLSRIRLFETARNMFEVTREDMGLS